MMPQAKILVVDDEPEIVRALTMRLRAAGYEVIAANDGLIGTKMAIQEAPDLVLLDIGMPCGNGHTVADRMRKNVKTMTTPFVFLTACAAEEDRRKAAGARAAGYLTKPFKTHELLDTIARVLKQEPDCSAPYAID